VENEREALLGRQRVHDHTEGARDRVEPEDLGLGALLRRFLTGGRHLVAHKPGARAPGPSAEHVDRHPSENGGEPARRVVDRLRIGSTQSEPRLLHGVVRVDGRPEDAGGRRVEVWPVLIEEVINGAHGRSV
jgi:hypothetical protein